MDLGIEKTVEKCQRRLSTSYKYLNSWKRNQSGGQIWKSVFYDKIDTILGTRDVVTHKKVLKARSSTAPASQITPFPSPDDSSTQPSTSSRTRNSQQNTSGTSSIRTSSATVVMPKYIPANREKKVSAQQQRGNCQRTTSHPRKALDLLKNKAKSS